MNAKVNVSVVEDRVVVEHECVDGETVAATLNNAEWTIVRLDPLTVSPSVGCDRCTLHGWISDGRFWTTGGPRTDRPPERCDSIYEGWRCELPLPHDKHTAGDGGLRNGATWTIGNEPCEPLATGGILPGGQWYVVGERGCEFDPRATPREDSP